MLTNDLLDAVDALTKTRTTKVMQFNEHGISCVSEVEHDPRLQHLREAIVGGIGSHGGGSGETRLPFDAGALALYDAIEAVIGDWYVDLTGKPVFPSPEQTLRQWYIAFDEAERKGDVPEEQRWERERTLRAWARQIDGKFDPPKHMELTIAVREPIMVPVVRYKTNDDGYRVPVPQHNEDGSPMVKPKLHWKTRQPVLRLVERRPATCPECGENTAHDPSTGDRILALVIEYREDGSQTVENARIRCRSCEFEWAGAAGCRHVAWEIENEERRLNEERTAA